MKLRWTLLIGILGMIATVMVALIPPHLDFKFGPRTMISSSWGHISLDDIDFTSEPGELHSFAELERFYERQEQIYQIISADFVRVMNMGPDEALKTRPRELRDLPPLFWIQVFVGFAVIFISGWVWSLRARDFASFVFWLTGICIGMAAMSSAVYTTRELALPSSLFKSLAFLNALGGGFFGSVMLMLFLVYPVPTRFWKRLSGLQFLIFGTWLCLYVFRIAWANVNIGIVLQMSLICVAVGYQLWLSRDHAMARASLIWLGMSVIFGGGAFVVFNTIPVLLKITALNQGYSFVFLLFIYLGIGAGLTQFRIFHWRRWVFYLCFYSFGIVATALLYIGFLRVFGLKSWPSLGLALLLILILYMPLGDSLVRTLYKKD